MKKRLPCVPLSFGLTPTGYVTAERDLRDTKQMTNRMFYKCRDWPSSSSLLSSVMQTWWMRWGREVQSADVITPCVIQLELESSSLWQEKCSHQTCRRLSPQRSGFNLCCTMQLCRRGWDRKWVHLGSFVMPANFRDAEEPNFWTKWC